MTRLEIRASFPISDDQREQGRVMTKLDDATAAYEAAITAAAGTDVKISMRAVRGKEEKAAPVVEAPPIVKHRHAAE